MRKFRRIGIKAMALAATTVATATVAAGPVAAAPATADVGAAQTGPCPNSNAVRNFRSSRTVDATYSVSEHYAFYTFLSNVNERPVDGVPGLIKYCVYPSRPPSTAIAMAAGANGERWTSDVGTDNFAFTRPDGDPSNIPLDGTGNRFMGIARWGGPVPKYQLIVLHLNDPKLCQFLYGGNAQTCFVRARGLA